MASAPRDGSRILVTIRPSEQGPAEVDLAYWSHGDQFGAEGWRASDSSPGHIIEYAEPELKCWMPMPSANLNRTSMPSYWGGGDHQNLDGSGIKKLRAQLRGLRLPLQRYVRPIGDEF